MKVFNITLIFVFVVGDALFALVPAVYAGSAKPAIVSATEKGELGNIKKLLADGADVTQRFTLPVDEQKFKELSPLVVALANGDEKTAKYLRKAGASTTKDDIKKIKIVKTAIEIRRWCLACQTNLANLAISQEAYYSDFKKYVDDVSTLEKTTGFKLLDGVIMTIKKTEEKATTKDGKRKTHVSFIAEAAHPKCDRDQDGKPDVFVWDPRKGGLQ